jgi:hypothetical protein
MIRGVHTMFYSSQPEAFRAVLRDVLKLPYTDVGDGWLIFDCPAADMGVHPAGTGTAEDGSSPPGTHAISFFCDDIENTVDELRSHGIEFLEPIADYGYGLVTHMKLPGEVVVQLYQPHYRKA